VNIVDISVIIPTLNRAEGLRNTLRALTLQKYPRFEVIVVKGPSSDHTTEVLAEYTSRLRTANNPKLNLSISRNIGLSQASGEIVAFIDDDAIPYPGWLMELAAAFDGDHVGGAGGVVFDASGFSLQYRFSVCDRTGETRHDVSEPLEQYKRPGADPFLYLQGTNMSFRRRCLIEIGGFDEEFHYYYDDVDVSMRIIDRGYMLKALDHAAVLHKYLPSYARSSQGIIRDPFVVVKNRYYFALQSAQTQAQHARAVISLQRYCDHERRRARSYFEGGLIDRAQLNYCLKRIDEGVTTGTARAKAKRRIRHEFPPREPADFVPFAPDRSRGDRLSICFLSRELPTSEFRGVGRYPEDLAREAARHGHEVHIITHASEESEVDFKDGVWLHRLADLDPWPPELRSVPLNHNLMHLWGVYQEVCRIQELGAVDVVVAPLWLCEGALCALDPRFATVLTLTTAMKKISELHPSWKDNPPLRELIGLETETFTSARYIHAISQDVMYRCIECYGPTVARTFVLPLGSREHSFTVPNEPRSDEQVTVVFVGRLERRKGVDLLLEAAARLLSKHENLRCVLVGKDTENIELGETCWAAFKRKYATQPGIVSRLTFVGWVEESELQKYYASADICCFPSRYDPFGPVLRGAMAAGKPVVSTRVGGMPGIVEDSDNGLVVEPEDAEGLTTALEKLINDADLRRNMGRRSRELSERHLSIAIVAERILEDYQQIVRQHRSCNQVPGGHSLVKAFSGVLVKAAQIKPRLAYRIAKALLTQKRQEVERSGALHRLWHAPDEDFVTGLYRYILGRAPDTLGLRAHLESLRSGLDRLALLDAFLDTFLESEEFRQI